MRNRRRTAISCAAVALSTAVLIFTYCLTDGLMRQAVANTTNLIVGEAQLHAPNYRRERSFYDAIKQPKKVLAKLDGLGLPAAQRSYGYGLAAGEQGSAGVLFWGVDPERESRVFRLAHKLAKGGFLGAEAEHGLVLGSKLARNLKVMVGDEVVVVVQAADGSLGNDLYKVKGILSNAGDAIDRSAALMHQADFAELFVSGGRVHEIAVNTRGRVELEHLTAMMRKAAPNDEVKSWRELFPAISDMIGMMDSWMWIIGLIFGWAAGLGVMNTMLMSTFERMREFGIQKALGAGAMRIVAEVGLEALLLAGLGSIIGVLLGAGATWYYQVHPMDLSGFAGSYSMQGIAFDSLWQARLSFGPVWTSALTMIGICVLGSLYPAILAARLDPVKAINRI